MKSGRGGEGRGGEIRGGEGRGDQREVSGGRGEKEGKDMLHYISVYIC